MFKAEIWNFLLLSRIDPQIYRLVHVNAETTSRASPLDHEDPPSFKSVSPLDHKDPLSFENF